MVPPTAFKQNIGLIVERVLRLKNEKDVPHIRYSIVICGPKDFMSEGFKLRRMMYEFAERMEPSIVIPMYNEDTDLFHRTGLCMV